MGTRFETRRGVIVAFALAASGCAVSTEESAGQAQPEATGKTQQAMNVLQCEEPYWHGGNLWSEDFTTTVSCPCDPEQLPLTANITSTGSGSCTFAGWTSPPNPNAEPSQPQQCGFTMAVHNDGGYASGTCQISVEEAPIGHPSTTFMNDLMGSQASAWFGDGAINSVDGVAEVFGDVVNVWNAENIWVPTTPGASCNASIAVETSTNMPSGAVLLEVNREPSQQTLGSLHVGPLGPSEPQWTSETFPFTPQDTGELFIAGFWGQADAPWMLMTDLRVSCAPELDVLSISHPDATQDTYVGATGGGFVDGPVRLWYQGVPGLGDSDGWQYGAVLQATNNTISGWDQQTLVVGAWNGCQGATEGPGGVTQVQVMAIDSAGNESNRQTVPVCRICNTC